jgi:hypothetical protein
LPKRIEQSFECVVHVPATTVRGIEFDEDFQVAIEWANAAGRKDRNDLLSEDSTLATDERPCSHPPPVMVH